MHLNHCPEQAWNKTEKGESKHFWKIINLKRPNYKEAEHLYHHCNSRTEENSKGRIYNRSSLYSWTLPKHFPSDSPSRMLEACLCLCFTGIWKKKRRSWCRCIPKLWKVVVVVMMILELQSEKYPLIWHLFLFIDGEIFKLQLYLNYISNHKFLFTCY